MTLTLYPLALPLSALPLRLLPHSFPWSWSGPHKSINHTRIRLRFRLKLVLLRRLYWRLETDRFRYENDLIIHLSVAEAYLSGQDTKALVGGSSSHLHHLIQLYGPNEKSKSSLLLLFNLVNGLKLSYRSSFIPFRVLRGALLDFKLLIMDLSSVIVRALLDLDRVLAILTWFPSYLLIISNLKMAAAWLPINPCYLGWNKLQMLYQLPYYIEIGVFLFSFMS